MLQLHPSLVVVHEGPEVVVPDDPDDPAAPELEALLELEDEHPPTSAVALATIMRRVAARSDDRTSMRRMLEIARAVQNSHFRRAAATWAPRALGPRAATSDDALLLNACRRQLRIAAP
jgi:hypothetical protein